MANATWFLNPSRKNYPLKFNLKLLNLFLKLPPYKSNLSHWEILDTMFENCNIREEYKLKDE